MAVPRRSLKRRQPLRMAGALIALGVLAALLAACDGHSLDEVEPVEGVTAVAVEDNSFSPRVIRVPQGTEVTWDWGGASNNHNVVGDGFESPVQHDGEFSSAFDSPGAYDYRCTLHRGMTGRVIVSKG